MKHYYTVVLDIDCKVKQIQRPKKATSNSQHKIIHVQWVLNTDDQNYYYINVIQWPLFSCDILSLGFFLPSWLLIFMMDFIIVSYRLIFSYVHSHSLLLSIHINLTALLCLPQWHANHTNIFHVPSTYLGIVSNSAFTNLIWLLLAESFISKINTMLFYWSIKSFDTSSFSLKSTKSSINFWKFFNKAPIAKMCAYFYFQYHSMPG